MVWATLFALAVAVLVRNEVVHWAVQRRLHEVSAAAKAAIEAGQPWQHFYDRYDAQTGYSRMVLSFHKWTYKQFYPQPVT